MSLISRYTYIYIDIFRGYIVRMMVFNATFNNISVILWRSFLLMEELGVPGKTTDPSLVTDKLYHIVLYRVHPAMSRNRTRKDCGSKSNYHAITTVTTPIYSNQCVYIYILKYTDILKLNQRSLLLGYHEAKLYLRLSCIHFSLCIVCINDIYREFIK